GIVQGGDAVGELFFIRKGVMHQDAHPDLSLVHSMTEALQKRIIIVKAGIDFLDGAKDATFVRFIGIALARSGRVTVQVIEQTAAETVVKAGAGKMFAVFDIGRTAKADFAIRVEDSERINDGLLLRGAEMGGVREQIANRGEGGSQGNDVRRIIRVRREAPRNLGSQGCPAGKHLVQESVPQIKRESDGWRTVGGNRASQQAVIGRFAAEVLNVVRCERVA